jgi:PAS domain S-box-containing protein
MEILGVIPDPVIVMDSSGQVVAANNIVGKYTKPAEELVNKNLFELKLFDENQTAKIRENLIKRLEGTQIDPYEVSLKSIDGQNASLEVNAKKVVFNNQLLDVIVLRDVTQRAQERKNLELVLNNSERMFKTVSDSTFDGIVFIDIEEKIRYWNNAAERIYGYSEQEVLGKSIKDTIVSPKAFDYIKKIKADIINSKMPSVAIEIPSLRKSGEEFLAEISLNVAKVGDKEVAVASIRDVSGYRETEERFNGITRSIKDAIVLVNDEAKITYWNPAAEATFGYTSEEALGKEVHKLVLPESLQITTERVSDSIRAFSETGIGYFTVGTVEINGRRKDGSIFPAELSVSSLKTGGKWNAVGVVKDITRRKTSNQKLSDAEQRYHTLFSQSPIGVTVIDPETGKFEEFNDISHLQLGYSREEFEQLTIPDIEVEENPEQVKAHIKRVIQEGGSEFETKHRSKTGEIQTIVVTAKPFKNQGKNYIQCITRDITESKKIQNALATSEARYRQLVEVAQEGIWAIDNDFLTTFINPHMAKMLGYRESEVIGRSLLEFVDPAWAGRIGGIIKGFNREGSGQYEYSFPHRNGGYIDTVVTLSVIFNEEKQKIGSLAVISDITERKQLQRALKASEERFRAISTSAMDAIILSDQKDQILYWNPAAEKLYGYSEEEAVGKKLSELILPAKIRDQHGTLLKDLESRDIAKREFGITAIKKDGSTAPVDLSIVSVKLQDQKCLLATVKDVTEWKTMEEDLRQERDLLESVTGNTNIILALITPDYRIAWANKRAKLLTKHERLENKLCYEIFGAGASCVCPGCGVKRVYENNENLVRRDYSFLVDGKERWSELISTPIKDKNGEVIAALEISIDITERKRLQNKLAEYSQRLEEIVQKRTDELRRTQAELVKSERLAAIGELAGMIGHDLRNPLTGIKNSAYYLKKKGQDISPQQSSEMLEIIDKCVNYSNRIINDLLDYSKEIHLALEEQTPRRLLIDALAIITVPETVKINNKLEETPQILVDPDKIKRVIINLIKNAVDAMPDGGEITLESRNAGSNLEVTIADTGCGISDEVKSKLFTPLCTTKAQGMGFGLAICKRIIEAHKGTISVKTVKNQGTTFTITVPLNQKVEGGGETHG